MAISAQYLKNLWKSFELDKNQYVTDLWTEYPSSNMYKLQALTKLCYSNWLEFTNLRWHILYGGAI